MFKRIINGIFYVSLLGALMLGVAMWLALVSAGPWYSRALFVVLALAAFSLGYNSEGGGEHREADEDASAN